MIKSVLAAAVLAATTTAASATCSTASLKGDWVIIVPEAICTATVAANGSVTGGCGKGKLALSSVCKITGTLYGHKVTGRTDNQAEGKQAPTVFIADAASLLGVMAYRK